MNKKISIIFLLVFLPSCLYSDSPDLQAYIQRFINADLSAKAEILREASRNVSFDESSGQFYEYALQFVLDNYAQMGSTREMNRVVNISINGLREKGRAENTDVLWRLFLEYPDAEVAAEIVIVLGVLGKGDQNLINNLNDFLIEKKMSFMSGAAVNYTTVSACISAIMELGDSSSYPALFSVICAGFPEVIVLEANGAMELIRGNLHRFLLSVIENNPPNEKFAAFKVGINSRKLSLPERGQIAELALEKAFAADVENADITVMRYAAISALASLRWTRANALAIRHYYRVQADYLQNVVYKERFLEAIACLGSVGNSDAALVLGLQLDLINARMESTGLFDAEITMAIVRALGHIGDNAAFNHLLNAGNLQYGEDIQAAAREAINLLKW